jgi:hypothetical protein
MTVKPAIVTPTLMRCRPGGSPYAALTFRWNDVVRHGPDTRRRPGSRVADVVVTVAVQATEGHVYSAVCRGQCTALLLGPAVVTGVPVMPTDGAILPHGSDARGSGVPSPECQMSK